MARLYEIPQGKLSLSLSSRDANKSIRPLCICHGTIEGDIQGEPGPFKAKMAWGVGVLMLSPDRWDNLISEKAVMFQMMYGSA